ncbi:MAG: hypothetical protein KIH89_003880 [Candidatus Shapirobacteria bacterium]|nr:hypothetical protein [Candidatus Shapirobacteria bacterium]
MKQEKQDIKGMIGDLEIKLEEIFVGKLWTLPKKAKEVIVTIAPYLSLISLVVIIPMVLALLGMSFFTPVAFLGGVTMGFGYTLSVLFGLVGGILALSVIPGLFKRQIKAWRILFWVSLINAVGKLLSMDLGNLIIGTAISWYILFQVKEYYK